VGRAGRETSAKTAYWREVLKIESRPLILEDILDQLLDQGKNSRSPSFRILAEIAGLDPAKDFVGASLRDMDFRYDDLRGFDFSGADLAGCDFRRANVLGVRFARANLVGAIGLSITTDDSQSKSETLGLPMGPDRDHFDPSEQSDESLLFRIAEGDRLSLEALYVRHRDSICRFITRMVNRSNIAHDLTNEVFLAVWQQAGQFEHQSTVIAWMKGIARFKALTILRRRKDEELDDEIVEFIQDPDDSPEVVLHHKSRTRVVQSCLSSLPTEYRQVIDLAYYQEMPLEEVAKLVGITPNAVSKRLARARTQLSHSLRAFGITVKSDF
jgi:RNA polymerase sigma-70 factor (ECF subfamily)